MVSPSKDSAGDDDDDVEVGSYTSATPQASPQASPPASPPAKRAKTSKASKTSKTGGTSSKTGGTAGGILNQADTFTQQTISFGAKLDRPSYKSLCGIDIPTYIKRLSFEEVPPVPPATSDTRTVLTRAAIRPNTRWPKGHKTKFWIICKNMLKPSNTQAADSVAACAALQQSFQQIANAPDSQDAAPPACTTPESSTAANSSFSSSSLSEKKKKYLRTVELNFTDHLYRHEDDTTPIPTQAELYALMEKSKGGKGISKLDRNLAFFELTQKFPELWELSCLDERLVDDPKENSSKSMASLQKGTLREGYRRHLPKNLRGVRNVPHQMCFMVENVPIGTMKLLLAQYGDVSYQKHLQKHGQNITLSSLDAEILENYTPETCKCTTLVCECKDKSNLAKHQSSKIYSHVEKEQKAQETSFLSGKALKKKAAVTGDEFKKFCKEFYEQEKAAWEKQTLKGFVDSSCATSLLHHGHTYKEFHKLGLDMSWTRCPRAQFLMDVWGAARVEGLNPLDAEPTDEHFSSLDSKFQTQAGATGVSELKFLARDALEHVLYKLPKDHKLPQQEVDAGDAPDLDHPDDDPAVANLALEIAGVADREDADGDEDDGEKDLDKDLDHLVSDAPGFLDRIGISSGIIRTGKSAGHQDLHIDDGSLPKKDGGDLLSRMQLSPGSVSPEEWLKAGYLIDMPLSKEGSWIRLAVPDPNGGKHFMIFYHFIPFGAMLIRSMAVFHSGHYGSPGNTRLHAVLFVKGESKIDTKALGYLRPIIQDAPQFKDWSVGWAPWVLERFQRFPRLLPAADFSFHKRVGTKYMQLVCEYRSDQLDLCLWLLNPVDPKTLKEYHEKLAEAEAAEARGARRQLRRRQAKAPPRADPSGLKQPPTSVQQGVPLVPKTTVGVVTLADGSKMQFADL
jgi:hypothetical protein